MESSDPLAGTSSSVIVISDTEEKGDTFNSQKAHLSTEDLQGIREQAISNVTKPNVPNVNVPERIILCIDVCYADQKSLYRLGDGTTFTPINMLKKVLDFFVHTKSAINKRTEFALLLLKEDSACWVQNFTNNVKEIINKIDMINASECNTETYDFDNFFDILKKVEIPKYDESNCILPPPYVVRAIVLYGRTNCVPVISLDDPYFNELKKQLYFYVDILLIHEEDCALYKCEEIYDALQDLDNGYSYVCEVSRNPTKIHDSIAQLLAHPLQRPLQKNIDYTFGSWHG